MKQSLDIGATLGGGRYVIEKVLGIGGFGITYYVKHKELGSHYAIKEFFINGKCMREDDHNTVSLQEMDPQMYHKLKTRFADEARTLAALNHPHVVRVNDIFDENNTSYIVMEYVEGTTLQQLVETNGKMSYDFAVNCMGQLGEAVAYIHSKHVLHRDIKPENLIITPENKLVLIDFGSAREFVHDEVQRHTAILTMGYAPIEQYSATSKKGNYTDIYAMGGVFYFLLTGQRPADVTTRTMEPMPSPHDLDPTIPMDVSQTIMKAMEFKPEDRYQSVDAFMADLLSGTKESFKPNKPQPITPAQPTKQVEPTVEAAPVKKKSKAGLILGIVFGSIGLFIVFILVLAFIIGSSDHDNGSSSQYTDYNYSSEQTQTYEQPAAPYEEPAVAYEAPAESAQTQYEYLLGLDLSARRLSESDLYSLNAQELTYLRNSIYAKHGREFQSNELRRYFNQFYWYSPNSNYSDSWLNANEKYNTSFIKQYQEEYGMEYKPN